MQFMLHIIRSAAVAYQHLLEKFLRLLINLVLMCRDAYLKNAHNSLDAYHLKNLQVAPISGPAGLRPYQGTSRAQDLTPMGNKRKRLRAEAGEHINKGVIIRSKYPLLNNWYPTTVYPNRSEADFVVALGVGVRTQEVFKTNNNSHFNNDTLQPSIMDNFL